MPANHRGPYGLQAWLIAEQQQLAAAIDALGRMFAITSQSVREPVGQGRHRVYLHMTPRAVTPGDTTTKQQPEQEREGLWPAT